MPLRAFIAAVSLLLLAGGATLCRAEEEESPRDIVYPVFPPAPAMQTPAAAEAKSAGCVTCHTATNSPTMHTSPGSIWAAPIATAATLG